MASAANNALRALVEGLHHMSTTLDRLMALLEVKAARECLVAIRLQAAARCCWHAGGCSLPVGSSIWLLSPGPSCGHHRRSGQRCACKQQGEVSLFGGWCGRPRMLLSPSLQQIAACTFNHSGSPICPAAPAEVEIWVCGLPVRRMTSATQHQAPMAMAVSFVLALTLVLGRSSVLVGWYILHSSFHMKLEVGLLPWDPGGHSCSSNLFLHFK
jgi:hypothetical protein